MKNISKLMVAALALGSTAWMATAQTNDVAPPGGPGMRGHRMPPPFIQVLDANRDGVIDTDEMANAAPALKTLDKDGDGKLSSRPALRVLTGKAGRIRKARLPEPVSVAAPTARPPRRSSPRWTQTATASLMRTSWPTLPPR
ncbi:MAG: hypothetical protein NTX51_16670 [Verrucomicrobia bacterium]|nr:hypothetical protein [Verrucomicrobiota bacterium]